MDDSYVVLAKRKVVERFAIHVHDETVADCLNWVTLGVLEHARGVDRDMALRIAEHREILRRCGDGPLNFDALAHEPIVSGESTTASTFSGFRVRVSD